MANGTGNIVDQNMVELFAKFSGKDPVVTTQSIAPSAPVSLATYSLRDTSQKGLYLQEENLVVAPLDGPNNAHEEVLSVLPNKDLWQGDHLKFPLILGVQGGSKGLSCGKADQPKMQLENVSLEEVVANGPEEAKRFTFFKTFNGSTHMFESAAYPNWFICSSVEAHKPLSVTAQPREMEITNFLFDPK